MSVVLAPSAPRRAVARIHPQWTWLGAGLALAFALPFVLTDVFTIDRDLYYGIYAAAVFGFVALWLRRGVVYGATDGVLLSVFPILAVFAAFASRPLRERTRRGVVGIGALALATSLVFTAVYHLGYPDFRGSKLKKPVAVDLVSSVPTLVTPYRTETFLPPHVQAASTRTGAPARQLAGASPSASVKIYLGVGDGSDCARVKGVRRVVARPAVLRGAMAALLKGPTAAEKRAGLGGWFTARTAGMLRSVRLSNGTAYVDFRDLRRVIPNASSSCGSTLLLAQLDRTARQFASVRHALYSLNGNRRAFYEWLQLTLP